jgi:acyl-CoA thioester hydrolase
LVSGELVYVYADVALRKAVPIPDDWRATIARIEKLAPSLL